MDKVHYFTGGEWHESSCFDFKPACYPTPTYTQLWKYTHRGRCCFLFIRRLDFSWILFSDESNIFLATNSCRLLVMSCQSSMNKFKANFCINENMVFAPCVSFNLPQGKDSNRNRSTMYLLLQPFNFFCTMCSGQDSFTSDPPGNKHWPCIFTAEVQI